MVHPWTAAALLRVVADLSGVPIGLGALERAARALADQIDEFLAQRPSLREQIDALRQEEQEDVAGQPPPPAGELPSSDLILRDLEEFLRGLRGEDAEGG
jgi:hypothetical protein